MFSAPAAQPAEPAENNPPPRNIKEVVEQQQSIHVEVMSSKTRVYIKVDSATVIRIRRIRKAMFSVKMKPPKYPCLL